MRRRYNLVASTAAGLATSALGVGILLQQDLEKVGSMMFGLDPIFGLVLLTAGFGAVGWLVGPFAGNWVFGVVNRRLAGELALVSFFSVLLRWRVAWTCWAEDCGCGVVEAVGRSLC